MNTIVFWLSIEIKHFIADYLLQTEVMYEGKRGEEFWLFPLLCHSGVNAAGVFLVVWLLTENIPAAITAFFIELISHALIDRSKLFFENIYSRFAVRVIDQLLHQATYLLIYFSFM